MAETMRGRARPFSVILALLVVTLSLGVGGNAWAAPGYVRADSSNGHNGSATSVPPGQATKEDGSTNGTTSEGAESSSASPMQAAESSTTQSSVPGKSGDAPGHNKDANGGTSQAAGSQAQVAAADTTDPSGPAKSDHSSGNASTQGDVKSPQPLSNADQNNPGTDNTSANGKCPGGPYCSTRDGSPSLNGSGTGKATGKPCAGCVGKADNKNPHGQYPDPKRDGNNGYECDGNNGIGKTNPAHTGCTTPPTTDCHSNNSCPKPPCSVTDSCPKPPCSVTDSCPKPPCSVTDSCPPQPNCQSDNSCPTTCPNGQVMNDNGTCSCPSGMSEDSNGGCAAVGPAVYVCPNNLVMHSNGTCSCPKGDTMIKGKCTPPDILGIQKFRPRPNRQVTTPQVAPLAAGLPNTGADQGLGIYAMTGAGLLLAGGALMLLRRKTVRR